MSRCLCGFGLCLVALAGGSATPRTGAAQVAPSSARRPFSFVVLGHVRGEENDSLNPKLGELLDRVRALKPDFAVLTGDMIWGDVHTNPVDSARVEREWNALDSALATLRMPVYRVPGNHDISDLRSRDVYIRRYGRLPQVLTLYGTRLILLSSAWIPADGDTRHNPYVRPRALDSTQVRFLQEEMARPGTWDQTFVFMHHLLWWYPDAPWWRDVHPWLARAKVRAVFGGDYGPMKFSAMSRDGVDYIQCSMETPVPLVMLKNSEKSLLLSSQFDNFLYVTVNGPQASIQVKTLGEYSSGMFTPQMYEAIHAPRPEDQTLRARLGKLIAGRWGLVGIALAGAAAFLAGAVAAVFWTSRRARG